jgi:hypothetical protein
VANVGAISSQWELGLLVAGALYWSHALSPWVGRKRVTGSGWDLWDLGDLGSRGVHGYMGSGDFGFWGSIAKVGIGPALPVGSHGNVSLRC